jgi:hypothetical protein
MESHAQARGVLTLAYGHTRFIEQARYLGYSLRLHAPRVSCSLVTDSKDPSLSAVFDKIIPLRSEYGSGVRQKLYLDHYSPYRETLFIDSDCLVLSNLDGLWAAFSGQYFGVPGFRYVRKGYVDPYMDLDFVLDQLNLIALPKFNGGTYYFTDSAESRAFFETARGILNDWRKLRLAPFRKNGPADEAIYAVAMAIHRTEMTYFPAGGMWTPCGYKGKLILDGLRGFCSFEKDGELRTPEIVHFPGEYIYCFAYTREKMKIRKAVDGLGTPAIPLARAYFFSLLWRLTRVSPGLSRLGRSSVRAYRAAARALNV